MEDRVEIPEAFIERMKLEWPDEVDEILAGLEAEGATSIQVNAIKGTTIDFEHPKVPWFEQGMILASRPIFPLDPLWHSGSYYVQDASSMFLGYVLSQLPLPANTLALDFCASPGGKSLIFQNILKDKLELVSNEIHPQRNSILRENLTKAGYGNVMVTQADSAAFLRADILFDAILIDAPCSGEGMFRKDMKARTEWSPGLVEKCARRQEEMLDDMVECLKPGGVLIYSTCTFAREENESQIDRLLSSGNWEVIRIPVEDAWGLVESRLDSGEHCGYRFFPHRLKAGEGLFMSVIRKKGHAEPVSTSPKRQKRNKVKTKLPELGEWLPDGMELVDHFGELYAQSPLQKELYGLFVDKLKVTMPGIALGEMKGKDLIPAHSLALSTKRKVKVPVTELSREEALEYLRRNPLSADQFTGKGWQLVSYNSQILGWVKVLPNRINNYYPKGWRLLLS